MPFLKIICPILISTVSLLQAQTPAPTIVPSGGNIPSLSLRSVQFPSYPPIAKMAHLESVIKTFVDIDWSGSVNNVKFREGKQQLYSSVLKAVSRWRFNEKLVYQIPVEFHFMLSPTFSETTYRIDFEPTRIIVVIEAQSFPPTTDEHLPVCTSE